MKAKVDLNINDIYLEEKGTLASRIDFAWLAYNDKQNYLESDRKKALKFLMYAFDISDLNNINDQIIIRLMKDKDAHKATNPEYIPGKSPTRIPFDPRKVVPQQTVMSGYANSSEITEAIKLKELLDVTERSKQLDKDKNTIFLKPEERAARRVNIHQGLFNKDGAVFDTSHMKSHKKDGFAAYTLNANGEISVFTHNQMADRFAHSSMNAGSPVVAAGELKIEYGVLKAITTHSGHYQPSLFNVYRVLEHFSLNNVDISQAKVVTFESPEPNINGLSSKAVHYPAYNCNMYETPATEIFKGINNILDKNIASINTQVEDYKKGGFFTSIYTLKDKITGSELTKERAVLASKLKNEITDFKEGIKDSLTPEKLRNKCTELEKIIIDYEDKNDKLSQRYNKNKSSGRLADNMVNFKSQLRQLKQDKSVELDSVPDDAPNMKNIS